MGLKLDRIVPWGRSFSEYVQMFALTATDLQRSILDCAGGPASFNATMKQKGYPIIACDPIYQFSPQEIAKRIEETYPKIIKGLQKNIRDYIWTTLESPDNLGRVRMAAMQQFLEDFYLGIQEGRYLTYALPTLPFSSNQFDLGLCSHFLFTYSEQLSLDFHVCSILEMCRVASEVRIFPILTLSGERSPFVDPVTEILKSQGYSWSLQNVSYEFQRGGNQLLVIRHL